MSFLSSVGPLLARPGIQVIAGLLSGAVGGGALVASGAIPFGGSAPAPPEVALMACPGSGPVLARVPDGQALLVTARSADGAWLQINVGQPGLDRGWAPAAALRVESGADALPVADCSGPTPAPLGSPVARATAVVTSPSPEPAGPSATPGPPPTAHPTATPTPRPTLKPTPKPTPNPTPKPTPEPDTTAPHLSNLLITAPGPDPNDGKYYIYGQGCPPPQSATIQVTATDPDDAVASITLFYLPVSSGVLSTQMTETGTSTWTGTITAALSWDPGQISYWVQAVDSHGNKSPVFDQSNNYILSKGTCFF
jgi:hypothetical protein